MTHTLTDAWQPWPRGSGVAELRAATKTFHSGGTSVQAVAGVDLTVRTGELLAVLGPNGAGKSTSLGMLTGLTAPTSGTARVFGTDPRDLAARQRMGVMLQSSGVPDTLRVRELITAFRGYYPAPLTFSQVVDTAGLDGLEHRLFGTLSGGQQRRVLFGLALCGNPEMVFVDEPTTGLDADVRRLLWATLRGLASAGRAVVLTTHYLEEADALADRIVVLHHGRVIAEGSPAQIKARVPGRRITAESSIDAADAQRWMGVYRANRDGNRLDMLVGEPEVVLRQLLRTDASVRAITVTEPSLEAAFLTLTDRTETAA